MTQSVKPIFASFALLLFIAELSGVACNKSDASNETAQAAEGVNSAEPGAGKKHELPPAAFDACSGKAAGDACTVQFGDKQIETKCAAAPDGRLACHPQRAEHKKAE